MMVSKEMVEWVTSVRSKFQGRLRLRAVEGGVDNFGLEKSVYSTEGTISAKVVLDVCLKQGLRFSRTHRYAFFYDKTRSLLIFLLFQYGANGQRDEDKNTEAVLRGICDASK